MTSIFQFTTGHPALDAWLRGAHGVTRPTSISAPEKDTVTRQTALDGKHASIPARAISRNYWQGHNGRGLNRPDNRRG